MANLNSKKYSAWKQYIKVITRVVYNFIYYI